MSCVCRVPCCLCVSSSVCDFSFSFLSYVLSSGRLYLLLALVLSCRGPCLLNVACLSGLVWSGLVWSGLVVVLWLSCLVMGLVSLVLSCLIIVVCECSCRLMSCDALVLCWSCGALVLSCLVIVGDLSCLGTCLASTPRKPVKSRTNLFEMSKKSVEASTSDHHPLTLALTLTPSLNPNPNPNPNLLP